MSKASISNARMLKMWTEPLMRLANMPIIAIHMSVLDMVQVADPTRVGGLNRCSVEVGRIYCATTN